MAECEVVRTFDVLLGKIGKVLCNTTEHPFEKTTCSRSARVMHRQQDDEYGTYVCIHCCA